MNIQEIREKLKRFRGSGDLTLALLIIAVGGGSFMLGRASVEPQNAVYETVPVSGNEEAGSIIMTGESPRSSANETTPKPVVSGERGGEPAALEGGYVASKSGTKYHLPWCPGAQRIKEENKIWFKTKAEAEAAGYTPAVNCKGI